jgi:hypothetical protein
MFKLIRLDSQHQPLLVIDLDIKHMHAGNIEHRIGPGTPARTRTTHTVGHRRGLGQTAWSLLILKAPTPSTHDQHATPRYSPMLICEDPHFHATGFMTIPGGMWRRVACWVSGLVSGSLRFTDTLRAASTRLLSFDPRSPMSSERSPTS